MSLLHSHVLREYAVGLLAIVAGAAFTDATGSFWPLALGASLALVRTAALVQAVRARAAGRRQPPFR